MGTDISVCDANQPVDQQIKMGGHTLSVRKTSDGGSVCLISPEGSESLQIVITPSGAEVRLTRGLTIAVTGTLAFDADQVSIRGRSGLSLSTGGAAVLEAEGSLDIRAHSTSLTTTHGNVSLRANDDVVLLGERILANC
jgi:hypothetical protein